MRRDLNSQLIETNTGRCVGRRKVFEATRRSDLLLRQMISWSAAKAAGKVMLDSAARRTCPRLGALRRKPDPASGDDGHAFSAHWSCLLCWQEEGKREWRRMRGKRRCKQGAWLIYFIWICIYWSVNCDWQMFRPPWGEPNIFGTALGTICKNKCLLYWHCKDSKNKRN